jgi:hypothetical protein
MAPFSNYASIILLRMAYRTRPAVEWIFSLRWAAARCVSTVLMLRLRMDAAAVSGADPIQGRPGFAALLDRIKGNGVRTVIVEDTSRFAPQLMTQELGIALLIKSTVPTL